MWWFIVPAAAVAVVALTVRTLIAARPKREDTEKVRRAAANPDSLFGLLQADLVPFEELEDEFGPALKMVQQLIGVQPSCDPALAIWRPAFHGYNVTVPGCLNLPAMLFGMGTDRTLVCLAMYASSRAASCRYCTLHTCSFGLRRGATAEVLQAVAGDRGVLSEQQQAVADVAWSLGQVPTTITAAKVERLRGALSPGDAEWIVAAVAMFGSFNKLMDGLGVPLESPVVVETRGVVGSFQEKSAFVTNFGGDPSPSGLPPRDSWTTYARAIAVALFGGGAALDSRLVTGVPSSSGEAVAHLQRVTGASFECVFRHLKHGKFIQTVATVVGLNFRRDNSVLGLERKLLCGALFARRIKNATLGECVAAMARAQGLSDVFMAAAQSESCDDPSTDLALRVAVALSSSPAAVTAELVQELRTRGLLSSAMLVELVSCIAVLQMLHRILAYYEVKQ